MQSKVVGIIILLFLINTTVANAEEISVIDADYVWNLTLDAAAEVGHLDGEPDVMVVKYADVIASSSLEKAAGVEHLEGDPGVMVVKYADVIASSSLEKVAEVEHLEGSPGIIVVKYADYIAYKPLEDTDNIQKKNLELTIDFPHNGDIVLNSPVTVHGSALSPNNVTNVSVNGVPANGNTSWSAEVPLSIGVNTITVEAVTNTSYSRNDSIKVFYYVEGNFTDADGDGIVDVWDLENDTVQGYLVNPEGKGFLFGDFNNNGRLDSGDVTILMQRILEFLP